MKNTNVSTTFNDVSEDMFGEPTYSNTEFTFYTRDTNGEESCFVLNVGK